MGGSVSSTNSGVGSVLHEQPPSGFVCLRSPDRPTIDIVFVHGINGHRTETWRHDIGAVWPLHFLPNDARNARILAYGYDGRTHGDTPLSNVSLHNQATTLLSRLTAQRDTCLRRPVVFVCHSTGGILVKEVLISSRFKTGAHLPKQRMLHLATVGVLFFGTPQQGLNSDGVDKALDLRRRIVQAASVLSDRPKFINKKMLQDLKENSDWLDTQASQFLVLQEDMITRVFYEEKPTILGGKEVLVVPKSSAALPGQANVVTEGVDANHFSLVKFAAVADAGYKSAVKALTEIERQADAIIRAKWAKAATPIGDVVPAAAQSDVDELETRMRKLAPVGEKRLRRSS